MNRSVNQLQLSFGSGPGQPLISLQAAEANTGQVALCAAIGLAGEASDAPEWVHRPRSKETAHGRRLFHPADRTLRRRLRRRDPNLVRSRAYRGISPVILHDKAGNVDAVLRASLVNKPNLKGLVTLHSEQTDMDILAKLIAALKLPTETSEDTLVAAITTMHGQQATHQVALQAQIDPVAEATGLAKGAKLDDVVAAIKTLVSNNGDAATIVALQGEVKQLGTDLLAIQESGTRQKAETFVDAAIAKGRVGVKPQRDRYITMHMADPAGVEAIINDLPALGGRVLPSTPPGGKGADGKRVLTAEQEGVISRMSLDRDAYVKTLDAQEQAEAAL
ncbi:MAG: hypothetical protein B7Z15_17370 [Rhizobiales bacterium 32-66-8]|nr:MAG: hypothetical protein B7Z15_17370 [Rhizobiales bacterium 32-66-8]